MSHNLELGSNLILGAPKRAEQRRAALRIAAQVIAEHPDLTVAEIAKDPVIANGYRELHDAIFGTQHSRSTR